jgi:hypothetical protein
VVEEFMRKPLSFVALVATLALGLVGCKRGSSSGGATSEATVTVPEMTESYPAKNGLITVHYPASFAAETVGTSAIVLVRDLPGGLDEALTFVPIETPISRELREFARVIGAAEVKELKSYVETSSLPATCAGKPGLETTGTWRATRGTLTYLRKACHFIHNGHGYSIAYSVPSTLVAEEEPTLRAIRDATQFNR